MKRIITFLATLVLVSSFVGGALAELSWDILGIQRAEEFLKTRPDPATFRYVNAKGQVFESVPSEENGLYYLRSINENGIEHTFPKSYASFLVHLNYVYAVISEENLYGGDWFEPRTNIFYWHEDTAICKLMLIFPGDIAPIVKLAELYGDELCITQWDFGPNISKGINLACWYSTVKQAWWYPFGPFDWFEIHNNGIYAVGKKGLSTLGPYEGKAKKEVKAGALLKDEELGQSIPVDFGGGIAWVNAKGAPCYSIDFAKKPVTLKPPKGTSETEIYTNGEAGLFVYKVVDKAGEVSFQKVIPGENKDKPVVIEQAEYDEIIQTYTRLSVFPE